MLQTAPYFGNNLEAPVILQIWNQWQSCQMALCPNIWLVFDQLCCKYWSDLANQTSFMPSRKAFGWYSIVQLSIVFGASRSSGNCKKNCGLENNVCLQRKDSTGITSGWWCLLFPLLWKGPWGTCVPQPLLLMVLSVNIFYSWGEQKFTAKINSGIKSELPPFP